MLKINYPLLDLLSQSTDSILYRNSTRWTSFTSTSLGRSLAGAASEAVVRTLISAARTDGANTFTGDQLIQTGTSPKLSITETSGATVYLEAGGGRGILGVTSSSHGLNLQYNGGPLGVGGTASPTAQLEVTVRSASRKGVTIQGASGQSRPLLEMQDSLGAINGSWDASGTITLGTSVNKLTISHDGTNSVLSASNLWLDSVYRAVYVDAALYFSGADNFGTGILTKIDGAEFTVASSGRWRWTDSGTTSGTVDTQLARSAAGVVSVLGAGSALGSLITGAITAGASGTTTSIDSTGSLNLRAGVYHSVGGTAFFFGTATNLIYETTNYTWRNNSGSAIMTLSGAAGLAVNSLGSAVVPVTINLASGQTAAALSILDSLSATKFAVTAAGVPYNSFASGDTSYRMYSQDTTYDRKVGFFWSADGTEGGVKGDSQLRLAAANGSVQLYPNGSTNPIDFSWGAGNEAIVTNTVGAFVLKAQAASYKPLIIRGAASQTAPLNVWDLVSSTGATQVAADTYTWTNSTHATRTPRIVRTITDYGAERTYMQVDANGVFNYVHLVSSPLCGMTVEAANSGADSQTRFRHFASSTGFVFTSSGLTVAESNLRAEYLAAGASAWYGSVGYGAGNYNHLRIIPSTVSDANSAIDFLALRYAGSGYPTVRFSANGYTFNSGNAAGWSQGNGVQYGTPTLTETGTGNWTFTARTSGTVPLSVVLASGQTANGIEQRTSLGAVNYCIDPNGWVGIGTSVPATQLHAKGASTTSIIALETTGSSTQSYFGNIAGATTQIAANRRIDGSFSNTGAAAASVNFVALSNNSYITFYTGPTSNVTPLERLIITKDGYIGINGTPGAQLHLTSSSSGVIGQIISLASGQTANGIEQRTSLGAANFSVSATGYITANGLDSRASVDTYGGLRLGYNAAPNINSGIAGTTAVGQSAGELLSSGAHNTFVGFQAGAAVTTGANNTVLGSQVSIPATASYVTGIGRAHSITGISNIVAIGGVHTIAHNDCVGLGTFITTVKDGQFGTGRNISAWTFNNLSTTTDRPVAELQRAWVDSTDASRTGRMTLGAYYTTTWQEGIRIDANSGGSARLGFYGATAAAKPTVTGSRTDGTALTSLLTALAALGLITDSTTA